MRTTATGGTPVQLLRQTGSGHTGGATARRQSAVATRGSRFSARAFASPERLRPRRRESGRVFYFATCFRISLVRNPIIIAAAAVSLSGITGQMELSATNTFFVP